MMNPTIESTKNIQLSAVIRQNVLKDLQKHPIKKRPRVLRRSAATPAAIVMMHAIT